MLQINSPVSIPDSDRKQNVPDRYNELYITVEVNRFMGFKVIIPSPGLYDFSHAEFFWGFACSVSGSFVMKCDVLREVLVHTGLV